jgi:heme-degrading monooxygenase HmoA
MHCRAVSVQIQSGKTQEAIDLYTNSVVPAAKAQKGFGGAYLMTDAASGKALSITVWESQANMEAGEAGGYYQEQIAKFGSLFTAPPVIDHYEVSVDAGPGA